MALQLKTTPARSVFKKMMGQNNHFLITILVGLDAVASGQVALSPTFSTTWSPANVEISARRSRAYAINSLLAWSVDSLDAYCRFLKTPPEVYLAESERVALDNELGRRDRLKLLAKQSGATFGPELDMVELLVIWRNKVVHTKARDGVTGSLQSRLLKHQCQIARDYRGLDIERAIGAVREGRSPSFKEITSLVAAAHKMVERLDAGLLGRINIDHCLRAALSEYVAEDPIRRSNNIWGRDQGRKRTSIMQVAFNYGMSSGSGAQLISDDFAADLLAWTPKEARRRLSSTGDLAGRG
nr:hypothetical protein [Mycobacterium sp. UM_NZ2]